MRENELMGDVKKLNYVKTNDIWISTWPTTVPLSPSFKAQVESSPGGQPPRPQVRHPRLSILVGAPGDGEAEAAALPLHQVHRGHPSVLVC